MFNIINTYSLTSDDNIVKDPFLLSFLKSVCPPIRRVFDQQIESFLISRYQQGDVSLHMSRITQRFLHERKTQEGRGMVLLDLLFHKSLGQNHEEYALDKTRVLCNKWIDSKLSLQDFQQNPSFVCFAMLDSYLFSQMRIFAMHEVIKNGQLLVEGNYMPLEQVPEQFTIDVLKSDKLICRKENGDIYTPLGNGLGLEKFNPYTDFSFHKPIKKVSDESFALFREKAASFVREGEELLSAEEKKEKLAQRPHTLQVVLVLDEDPKLSVFSSVKRVFNLLGKYRHSHFRLIDQERNMSEVGFLGVKIAPLPFASQTGHFRSPDLFSFRKNHKRVVLSIPISDTERLELENSLNRFKNSSALRSTPLAYRMVDQNCSTFVSKLLRDCLKLETHSSKSLLEVTYDALPPVFDFVKSVYRIAVDTLRPMANRIERGLGGPLVWAAHHIYDGVISGISYLPTQLLAFSGGGFLSARGLDFESIRSQQKPYLDNAVRFFRSRDYQIHLPSLVHKWMEKNREACLEIDPSGI